MSVKNESEAAAKCKKSDHVDDKFEIIYKPPSNEMLMLSTSFCSISSFACPLFLGNYAYDRFFEQNMELVEQVTTLELCSMGAATIISMFSLSFCRTIPLRIYKHEKELVLDRKKTFFFPSNQYVYAMHHFIIGTLQFFLA